MPRPKSDLSAITISKEPAASPPADDVGDKVYMHTLTLRLPDPVYRGLLRLASAEQERQGRRVSNQSLIERAVMDLLKANGVLR